MLVSVPILPGTNHQQRKKTMKPFTYTNHATFTIEREPRTHAYLRPFQYHDACRMRLWRKTRAYQTGAWVMMWVGMVVVGLCFFCSSSIS